MPTIEQARAWYSQEDPVHGFDHIERVLALAERIGAELRADLEILRAAALLHDADGSAPTPVPRGAEGSRAEGSEPEEREAVESEAEESEAEGGDVERSAPTGNADSGRANHHESSAKFAETVLDQEGWTPDRIQQVVECIESHRYRGDKRAASLEAKILFDADKLDVVGAFGVARTIGYALQAGQPIFAEPSERFESTGEREPGEVHSAYHEYLYKLRHVRERLYTETARRMATSREEVLKQFFEQLAAEARGKV